MWTQLNRRLNPIGSRIMSFRRFNELDERERQRIETLVSALNRAQKIRQSAEFADTDERILLGYEQIHNDFWKNRALPGVPAQGLFQIILAMANAIELTVKEIMFRLRPVKLINKWDDISQRQSSFD
jgi:hypothetical protein